jgi:hypothetical protein
MVTSFGLLAYVFESHLSLQLLCAFVSLKSGVCCHSAVKELVQSSCIYFFLLLLTLGSMDRQYVSIF